MMFTSLSKRSNVPGLRSGFVAGDASLIKPSCCTAPTTAAP
jgi:N-succinyldiaminopimelate aminotransferase